MHTNKFLICVKICENVLKQQQIFCFSKQPRLAGIQMYRVIPGQLSVLCISYYKIWSAGPLLACATKITLASGVVNFIIHFKLFKITN
jgi:hypothetical protein